MSKRTDSHTAIEVDDAFLRRWPLPEPSGSKRSRGEVLVVGGAPRSPGAAMLAGRAALRVGAGRLTLAVAGSVATAVAVEVPESGIVPLEESSDGHVVGRSVRRAESDLAGADAMLLGPGLDDIRETRRMLRVAGGLVAPRATVVLDAFALGAIAGRPHVARARSRILTPNLDEAELLLGRPRSRDAEGTRGADRDVTEIARRYDAVVSCHSTIASPDGRLFHILDGGPGLGTSGSGDALAGAIAGLAARGCDPVQAAVWGTALHAAAGRALASEVGTLGFLAGEIVDRLPRELAAVEQR